MLTSKWRAWLPCILCGEKTPSHLVYIEHLSSSWAYVAQYSINTCKEHFTLNYDSKTARSSEFPLIFHEAQQNKISHAWFQACRWSDIVYMGYSTHLIHLSWFYDAATCVPISTLDICQEGAKIKPSAHFISAPRSLLSCI